MLSRVRRRAAAVLGLAGIVLLATATAAAADPGGEFGEAARTGPDTVRIEAGTPGRPGGEHAGGGSDDSGCIYLPISGPGDAPLAERYRDVAGPADATWVRRTGCRDPAMNANIPILPAAPAVDPAVVAQHAVDQLRVNPPIIRTSPSSSRSAVVNFPTWMWVAPESWGQRRKRLTEGGVTVTAVARPERVVWTMGDGTTVTCTGPGTPYAAGVSDPTAPSPDCGHLYRRSSAGQPGERFRLTATLSWSVTWTVEGAAGGGTLPDLTTDDTTTLRVAEYQSLNARSP